VFDYDIELCFTSGYLSAGDRCSQMIIELVLLTAALLGSLCEFSVSSGDTAGCHEGLPGNVFEQKNHLCSSVRISVHLWLVLGAGLTGFAFGCGFDRRGYREIYKRRLSTMLPGGGYAASQWLFS